MTVISIVCVFLSLMGYSLYIQEKYDVPYGFGICISASFIISVLWLAGMFFPITMAVYTLFAVGLVLLAYIYIYIYIYARPAVIKNRSLFTCILNWTNLFLAIAIPCIYIYLSGRRFCFIDDFNHWGTIARSILENQALPNASDELIRFVSYPPGAALWICYFLTIIDSNSEDMYLFAQAILVVIYLCPVIVSAYSYTDSGKRGVFFKGAVCVCTFGLAAVCLFFGAQMMSLCVDGLLAASSIGLACFVLNYKGTIQRRVVFSVPLIISVLSIKDYGILYGISAVFVLLVLIKEQCDTIRKQIKLATVPVAAFAITELLWQLHASRTFSQFDSAPHALSIHRWHAVFNEHSQEEILRILRLFVEEITAKSTVALFVGLIAVLLFIYYIQKAVKDVRADKTLGVLTLVVVNYMVYLCGMIFVYLFSMETSGAVKLSSYNRYSGTEFCFLYGVCISYLFDIFLGNKHTLEFCVKNHQDQESNTIKLFGITEAFAAVVIAIGLLGLLSKVYVYRLDRTYSGTSRSRVNELVNGQYQGDALIYAPSQMDGYYDQLYIKAAAKYDLRSTKIDWATLDDINSFEAKLLDYSHILIYDVDDSMVNYLHEKGWKGECRPGLYSIVDGAISAN